MSRAKPSSARRSARRDRQVIAIVDHVADLTDEVCLRAPDISSEDPLEARSSNCWGAGSCLTVIVRIGLGTALPRPTPIGIGARLWPDDHMGCSGVEQVPVIVHAAEGRIEDLVTTDDPIDLYELADAVAQMIEPPSLPRGMLLTLVLALDAAIDALIEADRLAGMQQLVVVALPHPPCRCQTTARFCVVMQLTGPVPSDTVPLHGMSSGLTAAGPAAHL